nr:hypothetical protein L204_02882 [Cryptococcus depauperatus CBS 7855]
MQGSARHAPISPKADMKELEKEGAELEKWSHAGTLFKSMGWGGCRVSFKIQNSNSISKPITLLRSGQAIVSVRESVLGRWVVSSRLDGGDRRRVVYVAPPFGRDVGGVVVRGGAANRHVFAQCLAAQFVEDAAVHASRLISQGARPSP